MVDLLISISSISANDLVHQALSKETALCNRSNLSCNKICDLRHLCLDNTYLSYNGQLYQQCHGCPLGSPVSPTVSNLNMEQFGHLALSTYLCTGLQSWHRFVVLHSDENDKCFRHINAIDPNIKFTQVNILSSRDCLVTIDTGRTISGNCFVEKTHIQNNI